MKKIYKIPTGYEDVVLEWLKEKKMKVKIYAIGTLSFYIDIEGISAELIDKLTEMEYLLEGYLNIEEIMEKENGR